MVVVEEAPIAFDEEAMTEQPIVELPKVFDEEAMSEELMIEASRMSDAGLTAEDLAAWLPPGLPPELEFEAFSIFATE